MKKCKMCGSFLSNTATVCPKCGVECKEESEVKVEPIRAENNITPINMDLPNEEIKNENNGVNFCSSCGAKLEAGARFCPRCGKSLSNETPRVEVIDNYQSNNDSFSVEMNKLNNDYAKKATTNLTLAIVSIVLCCCSIPAIISLILSIISLKDLGKMSFEVKNTSTYRSIRNKNVIALIIACFVVFMWLSSLVENITNPETYQDLVNSINNIINGGY
jgi:uncharacterized membrane protein YvbJ